MRLNEGRELARALRAAYFAMHRRTNSVLAVHGVTADQYVLLSRLADEDGITQQELARRAASDANTIRPMLLLLEKRGLIVRRSSNADRRARSVLLTAKGRRQLSAMVRDTEACRRTMLAAISPRDAGEFVQTLRRIAESVESTTGRRKDRVRGGTTRGKK